MLTCLEEMLINQKLALQRSRDEYLTIDATTLPSQRMKIAAAQFKAPTKEAATQIRQVFEAKVGNVPKLSLENDVDDTTPPLSFDFIGRYEHVGPEVVPADPATQVGCQECKPDMGHGIGCEYTRKCTCLENAAVDEKALESKPEEKQRYLEAKASQGDMSSFPKRFPYTKPLADPHMPQVLQKFYLDSRHCIYECNLNCKCGPGCKSRVVQKGRRVPLIIFKTPDRGWGLKSSEDIVRGEFIAVYYGEIISAAEATLRRGPPEDQRKDSYLYSLDKFIENNDPTLTAETCHVVDGRYKGGPTRFMNHSCEPNCVQYTVSYNKHDEWIYNLAFFAKYDIPANTEITFDYTDEDEVEYDVAIRQREQAEREEAEREGNKREGTKRDSKNHKRTRCLCGRPKCRGFLW